MIINPYVYSEIIPPLDIYTGAKIAYSLRKLRTAYVGSSIRVRRSSDNTEQDIGFVGNDLDTSSLLSFVGINDGFITKWYDQSTNANHASQTTIVNQAQIISNGNLILDPNTNKITSTWGTKFYVFVGISPNTQYLFLSVLNRVASNNTFVSLGNVGILGTANGQNPLLWGSTGSVNSYMQTLVTHDTKTTTGAYLSVSEKNASNLKTVYLNGTALPTTATEAPVAGNNLIYFGRHASNYTNSRVAEMIYYDSEQSANRVGLQNNMNSYWTVY